MKKTWLIAGREIMASLRRRSYVFFAFVLPLLLSLVALAILLLNRGTTAAGESTQPAQPEIKRQGIVRPTGDLPDFLAREAQGMLVTFPNEAAAAAALAEGAIDGYYLVAGDYIQSGHVLYVTENFNPLEDSAGGWPVDQLLLADLVGDERLAELVAIPVIVTEQPLQEIAPPEGEYWIVELLPLLVVVILYLAIVMTAGNLVNAITDEKKNRVLEVLLASASPRQVIGGKILAMGLLGLLQLAVWIGLLWAVIRFGGQPLQIPPGFTLPTNLIVWMAVYSLLGYAMYGALMAGLGALAPDVKDTHGLSFLLQLPLIAGYMAAFFTFESPDAPLAIFGSFFPLTAPVTMIARMATADVPLWQALLAAALQGLTAVAIVLLAARLFRAQVLLSGEPVSAGRYFRALLARS